MHTSQWTLALPHHSQFQTTRPNPDSDDSVERELDDADWKASAPPSDAGTASGEILHLPHGRRARSDEWVVLHGTFHPLSANYQVHEDDTIVTLAQFAEREGLHRDSLRAAMVQHIDRGRRTSRPR